MDRTWTGLGQRSLSFEQGPASEGQGIAPVLYSRLAFPVLRRLLTVNPVVVYYHVVSDDPIPHISHLYQFRNIAQFRADLDVLLRWFRPLSLPDLLRHFKSGEELPPNSFLLTFDDGLRECYDTVAPILREKGVPATFFLCSAFVDNRQLAYDFKKSLLVDLLDKNRFTPAQERLIREELRSINTHAESTRSALLSVRHSGEHALDRIAQIVRCDFVEYSRTIRPYMTSDQIRELLKMGHSIGAHSIDHPRYCEIALADQLRQTRESLAFVKQKFSLAYGAFAFPSSDAGVSRQFFDEVLGEGSADVCFGNQGLLEDPIRRNVQRTSMEKTQRPAEAILGQSYARRLAKAFKGRLTVSR